MLKQSFQSNIFGRAAAFLLWLIIAVAPSHDALATGHGEPPPVASVGFSTIDTSDIAKAFFAVLATTAAIAGAAIAFLQRKSTEEKSATEAAKQAAYDALKPSGRSQLDEVRYQFAAANVNLLSQMERVEKRAAFNLGIGMAFSSVAIGVIAIQWAIAPATGIPWSDFAQLYLPRITGVAFIELFAFFFLRLYKNSLSEISEYQNDIIALTTQRVSIETVWESEHAAGAREKTVLSMLAVAPIESKKAVQKLDIDLNKVVDLLSEVLKKAKPGKADE